MEAKGNIRKEVFARRRAATQEEIQEKSRMIYEKITALPEFLDADCFFAYMDFKKEVMTRDLIEKALQMGKTVAVPRVEGDDMVYYEIKDFSTLQSGYFGIMEPDGGKVCTREEPEPANHIRHMLLLYLYVLHLSSLHDVVYAILLSLAPT